MKKLKIAALISGRGSNMASLIRAGMHPDFPAEVVLVLSNRPDAAGLEIAKQHGIPIRIVDHKEFATRNEHEAEVTRALENVQPDLVCLAGYIRILEESFVARWRGKLINIHPSLLPSFKGLHTHEQALERGVRVHGCTVHFVNSGLDAGPIVAQAAVPVEPDDTAETLGARVLEQEHMLYPKSIELIATGKVRWRGDSAVDDVGVTAEDVSLLG